MWIKPICAWLAAAVLALIVLAPGAAGAGNDQRSQVVGDMNVYLGVMSADAIRAQPAVHVEEQMHGAIPKGRHIYHVLVSLYDRASGERIEDAAVTARVTPLGLGGPARSMEIMYSAGVVCYCNWFKMAPGETHEISVRIDRPDEPVRQARFEYTPD